MVRARYARKRCAGPEERRLQAQRSEEDRRLIEALRRAQSPAQGRSLSFRAVDAHLLYQSRRQEPARVAQEETQRREGRAEDALPQGQAQEEAEDGAKLSGPVRQLYREVIGTYR